MFFSRGKENRNDFYYQAFAQLCVMLRNISANDSGAGNRSWQHMLKSSLQVVFLFTWAGSQLLAQASLPGRKGAVAGRALREPVVNEKIESPPAAPAAVLSTGVRSVLTMIQGGLPESVILAQLQKEGTVHNLTVEELVTLKSAGASAVVLQAMIAPSKPVAKPEVSVKKEVEPELPQESGVYFRRNGKLEMLEPEVIGGRTAGVLKYALTSGIMKAKLKGAVEGPRSNLQLSGLSEFIIRVGEGVGITEYQLVRMDLRASRREFEVARMGVVNMSTGTTPHQIKFKHEKLAPRVYQVIVAGLPSGEYGFLPPGAMNSSSGGSMGKVYTFGME